METQRAYTENTQMSGMTGYTITDRILLRIKEEKITPKSRWFFIVQDAVAWSVFIVAIIVTAITLSINIQLVQENYKEIQQISPADNGLLFMSFPYIWSLIFIFGIIIALRYIRNTKRGYQYKSLWLVSGGAIVVLVLGQVSYSTSIGNAVEEYLSHIPYYEHAVTRKADVWIQPQKGLLAGRVTSCCGEDNSFVITDSRGTHWVIIDSARSVDQGEFVKIIGTTTARGFEVIEIKR